MEHDGISSDHFFEECHGCLPRTAFSSTSRTARRRRSRVARIAPPSSNLTAFDLEVLIYALETEEPATYIGGVEREMRQPDD